MWQYNYSNSYELYHYGVLGMKWGVHRARSKNSKNSKLARKALDYDKKQAELTKKAERIHFNEDLGSGNRKTIKAANWEKKAAVKSKKALGTDNEFKKASLERKANKLKYKAAKARIEGEAISRSKGYGVKAMNYLYKSNEMAAKAAKARKKIANNQYYVAMMKRKASSLSNKDLQGSYKFVNQWLKG